MLIGNLSNTADKGGVTGLALYNNKGAFVAKYAMPTDTIGAVKGDGYGYDIAVNPARNVLLTSSFAGWNNYMRPLGEVVKDPEAMKHFGATAVVWNLKSMQPAQILSVPGAPLEMRWALAPGQNWAVTATALTSRIWLFKQDAQGAWTARDVASDRRSVQDPAAGGYLDHGQRQGAVGQHVHGRDHPLLRPHRSGASARDLSASTPAARST